MMAIESKIEVGATAPAISVLLVDQDMALAASMHAYFAGHGVRLESAYDGRRGLARILGGGYDLVLIDARTPELDGFELLRQVRRRSAVPVILLTDRAGQADRVHGLEAGADDCLPKPVGPEELLARIRAVLRRAGPARRGPDEVLEIPPVKLIASSRSAWCAGSPVTLTSLEFDILEMLVRSAGRVISRSELTAVLYQRRVSPFDRSLDVHVCHIRKKLGPWGNLIRTVRGVGYLFCSGSGSTE